MKTRHTLKHLIILATGALFAAVVNHTFAYTYHVDITTTPLVSNTSVAPYYLDFQFATGSTTTGNVGNNTISVNDFSFTGGSALGSATTLGSASGSLSGTVTLLDSSTPSELYQQFATSTTHIGFDVNSTLNLDAGLTPDLFTIAIMDSSLGSPAQIYTTAPDQASLATETINSTTTPSLAGYKGVGPANGSSQGSYSGVVASVPEPSSFAMFLLGLGGLISFMRHKRR